MIYRNESLIRNSLILRNDGFDSWIRLIFRISTMEMIVTFVKDIDSFTVLNIIAAFNSLHVLIIEQSKEIEYFFQIDGNVLHVSLPSSNRRVIRVSEYIIRHSFIGKEVGK